MVKIGSITAEIFLIWAHVVMTSVAWTNVTMQVSVCDKWSEEPIFKVLSKSGQTVEIFLIRTNVPRTNEYERHRPAPSSGLAPPMLIFQTSPSCNIFLKISKSMQPTHKGLVFARFFVKMTMIWEKSMPALKQRAGTKN